jgi:hypothetical protein
MCHALPGAHCSNAEAAERVNDTGVSIYDGTNNGRQTAMLLQRVVWMVLILRKLFFVF